MLVYSIWNMDWKENTGKYKVSTWRWVFETNFTLKYDPIDHKKTWFVLQIEYKDLYEDKSQGYSSHFSYVSR